MSEPTAKFNELCKRYHDFGLTGIPMREKEIEGLQVNLGMSLPCSYRAYLSIAGNGPPPQLVGSDCHAKYLVELRQWAVELLGENENPFELSHKSVVFCMHQGYQFFYFNSDGSLDDPPVGYYLEGEECDSRKFETFSDWVRVVACDGKF